MTCLVWTVHVIVQRTKWIIMKFKLPKKHFTRYHTLTKHRIWFYLIQYANVFVGMDGIEWWMCFLFLLILLLLSNFIKCVCVCACVRVFDMHGRHKMVLLKVYIIIYNG